jgi:hypothetical protein
MKKLSLYFTVGLITLAAISIYSCKKISAINNNTVVETPYSLYFSDTSGTLFVSTDGSNHTVVFSPDGKPCRSLVTSLENILWAKDSLYYSTNNGVNFNHSYDSLFWYSAATVVPNLPVYLNQSMMINIPTWGNNGRVYAASGAPAMVLSDGSTSLNYMGLVYSDNNGSIGSWNFENSWDTSSGVGQAGILPVNIYSFTQLKNGTLCAIAFEAPGTRLPTTPYWYERNFCKTGLTQQWQETTANPDGIATLPTGNSGGNPLPPHASNPTTSFFTLGHYNNRLIAIDNLGANGAWYSDDNGTTWAQYSGLPAGRPLLCQSSPFEAVALIGTDSAGLYILNINTGLWQQNNNGLASNLIVRNIAAKETVYKDGTVKKYVFLATNKGIFQSVDGGVNWVLTIPGNYVTIY